MHSLLEKYLSEVAAHLSALPVKRRNEELHEMRQHLLNTVTVNQELGQSEEDATQNAALQFGSPLDLGDNLVWAWRRERSLNRKSFWGAAALMLFSMYLRGEFLLPSVHLEWTQKTYHISHFASYMLSFALVDIPSLALMGAGIGWLFPKRAVVGAAVVQSIIFGWCTFMFFQDNLGFARTFSRSELDAWGYAAINFWYCECFVTISMILTPVLGAWLVSRRRLRNAAWVFLARG